MAERLLLDTHALIWWALDLDVDRLSRAARIAIEDPANEVYVSAVTAWEIATKVRIGKLEAARPLTSNFTGQMVAHGFVPLPLSTDHGERGGALEIPHGDPFDRMLIAQAQIENLKLVSNEKKFDTFGVLRFW